MQTFSRTAPHIYKLTYTNGTVIETTRSHPFYIQGHGWVKANDLVAVDVSASARGLDSGSVLDLVVGSSISIASIEEQDAN